MTSLILIVTTAESMNSMSRCKGCHSLYSGQGSLLSKALSSARQYLQQGVTSLNIRVALRLQKLDQRTRVIFILFLLSSSFLKSTHFTSIKGRNTLLFKRIKFGCWRESSDGEELLTQPEDLSPVPRTQRKDRPWWGSCNPRKQRWED